MPKIKSLNKKERKRLGGLGNFVRNADIIADEEYMHLTRKVSGPMSDKQIKDNRDIYRTGFIRCLELIVSKLIDRK